MTSDSFSSYRDHVSSFRGAASDDEDERRRGETAYHERMKTHRSRIESGDLPKAKKRDEHKVYDRSAVKLKITTPPAEATSIDVAVIDNSGSNRLIAQHMRESSGFVLATLGIIDNKTAMATMYASDHGDGRNLLQSVDYVMPTEEGDRVLLSSLSHIDPADGDDEPEAFECTLNSACDIDFGDVPKDKRRLYLVTDVVGHGMGMRQDNGCPRHRDWRQTLARVNETYGSFCVVGSGHDAKNAKLQAQFLAPERVPYDLIDLSAIKIEYRMRIAPSALLFLMARARGLQTAKVFLMALYEKWLKEPIFGANTDLNAKEAIRRFLKYLEITPEGLAELEDAIF